MRDRPRSRFDNADGSWNTGLLMLGKKEEFPEVVDWDNDYADECDKLSEEQAIKTGKQHWGRWVLNKSKHLTTLDCINVHPAIGNISQRITQAYRIELSRIGRNGESDGDTYTWQEHLEEKNWLGKKGLVDFKKAVKEIYQTHPEWLHQYAELIRSGGDNNVLQG
jgi:hypothetical protein